MVEEQIEKLLQEKFKEAAFSDCFLVELKLNRNKLEVFVDCDSNMTFEKCQKLSRYLEHHLDEAGWLGEKYTLEVSSPGVGRPLKFLRQYRKNIGRTLEVKLKEGDTKKGTLRQVGNESIVLEEKVRRKEGKKKKTELIETEIALDTIDRSIVKISF